MKTVIPDLLTYQTVFRFSSGLVDWVEIKPFASYKPVIHQKTDEAYVITKGEIAYYIDGTKHMYAEGDIFKVPRGVAHGFINFTNERVEILSILFPKYDPEDVFATEQEDPLFNEDLLELEKCIKGNKKGGETTSQQ